MNDRSISARVDAWYQAWVIEKPVLWIAGFTLAVLFFGYGVKDFHLDASADSLVLESDEDLRRFREQSERYSTREFLFVTFRPAGDLFSDRSLQAIGALKKDLESVKGISSVVSILDIPLVRQKEGTLLQLSANYRLLGQPDVDREKARRELTSSPLYSELVISADGGTTALQVNLEQDAEYGRLQTERNRLLVSKYKEGLTPEKAEELAAVNQRYEAAKFRANAANHQRIEDLRGAIARHAGEGELHLGGVPMIADDMISFVRHDLVVFGVGVFIFLVVMLSLIFRRVRWVLLPLASCLATGVLMVGLLGLIGWPVTVISSNFVSLMLIITMSMNVHLIVRYRQFRRDCPDWDQRTLVLETVRKMFWPCLYTALTTMVGFGSLVLSDIKPVIDFGWMMTLGLFLTCIISFLFFPAALMRLPRSDSGDVEGESVPFTAALATLTERHGHAIVIASVLLSVFTIAGMARLRVENSFVNYFSKDTEIYQSLKLIDDKLGGTSTMDIVIRFPEAAVEKTAEDVEFAALFGETDKADYWYTPEKIDLIKGIHDYLESEPAIGKVLSLASTVRLAESLTRGQQFDTFELGVLNKRLSPELRAAMLDPYVSVERNEARITMRVKDSLPDLRRKELLERVRATLQEEFSLAPEEFEITGLMVLYNNMLQSLFRSQILSLTVVMLGIFLMLLVLFRSWPLSLIGIIPNILASVLILGIMGWVNVPLDMMTITIASIAIGIAVDNSIHYVYRFREEFPKHSSYLETMHYCHASIGRAVFYTATIIVVGFSILVFSSFIPTIYFGLLTALSMIVALVLALTLLPRLILIWRPFGEPGSAKTG